MGALLVLIRRPHPGKHNDLTGKPRYLHTTPYELVLLLADIVLFTAAAWIVNRALGVPVPV